MLGRTVSCRLHKLNDVVEKLGDSHPSCQRQPTLWTHVSRASAAGWPGSRTYRRACRPPNGLSRISQGSLEALYGATFNPPTRCYGPLISHDATVQMSAVHRVL